MPRSSTVSLPRMNHGVPSTTWLKGRRHENIEAIQAAATMELTGIPKDAFTTAFRTCRNAGNSVLTAEGTTSKRTGSISCEVEFVFFTDSVSELYGQRMYTTLFSSLW
jgi:hypothetical protein